MYTYLRQYTKGLVFKSKFKVMWSNLRFGHIGDVEEGDLSFKGLL